MADTEDLKALYRRYIYSYLVSFSIVLLITFVLDYVFGRGANYMGYLFNGVNLVLFLVILSSYKAEYCFPKKFYYTPFGAISLIALVFFIPALVFSAILTKTPFWIISFITNFSLILLVDSLLEQKTYELYSKKIENEYKRYLLLLRCPKCSSINYVTFDNDEEIKTIEMKCSQCGYSYQSEFLRFVKNKRFAFG